jgi:hypothetical protein
VQHRARFDPNKNGRYYPPDVLKRAIEDAQPRIKAGRMIGQIDPPGDRRPSIRHASHRVDDVRVEEDGSVSADLTILDTPAGELLKQGLLVGYPCGLSTSGRGEVDENGIVRDFKLLSVDLVPGPGPLKEPSAVDKLAALLEEDDDDD